MIALLNDPQVRAVVAGAFVRWVALAFAVGLVGAGASAVRAIWGPVWGERP